MEGLPEKMNTPMSEEYLKDLHEPWAGKNNDDGSYRVADTHGKRAYHPYTKKGFKIVSDETPKNIIRLK